MKILIVVISMLVWCTSCVTYDRPVIYHKNYEVGDITKLNIHGYYANVDVVDEYVKGPYFFYPDGTVKLWPGTSSLSKIDSLLRVEHDWGRIGNYQILGDTLNIEYWSRDSGTILQFRRVILQFIIDDNSLVFQGHLNSEKELRQVSTTQIEAYNFYPSSLKPNSSSNWIREKKKWNK